MLREVRLLSAGRCRIDQSELMTGDPEGTMLLIPIWMYLLRADDALLLVDSGMPAGCIDNERFFAAEDGGDRILPQMSADDFVDRVLARQGLSVADVDAMISTHWHFDHAGGSSLLREKPVFIHQAELDTATGKLNLPPWVDLSLDHRAVDDGFQPVAGVTILHTPGHTPGHLSLLLKPAGGRPLLLTVDASYTRRNWETNAPGAMVDPALGQESVLRLKEIARAEDAQVFFGHDASQANEAAWRALVR